jgi:hypothetical protein
MSRGGLVVASPRGRPARAQFALAAAAFVACVALPPRPAAAYILPGTYPTSYKRGQVLYGAWACAR